MQEKCPPLCCETSSTAADVCMLAEVPVPLEMFLPDAERGGSVRSEIDRQTDRRENE